MLDVHPPHSPTHTWKDFFVHIATIVVGLLIAVGLEQTVEAIHRHREHEKLRAALESETQQILVDTGRVEIGMSAYLKWEKQSEERLSDAARDHHAVAPLPSPPPIDIDIPDEPIFKAARSSGQLSLLDEEEAAAYGELDGTLAHVMSTFDVAIQRLDAYIDFMQKLRYGTPTGADAVALATPEQRRQLYDVLAAAESASANFRFWSRQARGAATAMAQGERDLRKIQIAERQFIKLP